MADSQWHHSEAMVDPHCQHSGNVADSVWQPRDPIADPNDKPNSWGCGGSWGWGASWAGSWNDSWKWNGSWDDSWGWHGSWDGEAPAAVTTTAAAAAAATPTVCLDNGSSCHDSVISISSSTDNSGATLEPPPPPPPPRRQSGPFTYRTLPGGPPQPQDPEEWLPTHRPPIPSVGAVAATLCTLSLKSRPPTAPELQATATYSTAFQSADDALRQASLAMAADSDGWVSVDTLMSCPAPSPEHMQRCQACVDGGRHTFHFNAWMTNDDEDTMNCRATHVDHLSKFIQQLQAMNAFISNTSRNGTWVLEDKLKETLRSGCLRYQSSTKLSSCSGFIKFGCEPEGSKILQLTWLLIMITIENRLLD